MIRHIAALGLLASLAAPAAAADITVEDAFARASRVANAGGAFMTIHNAGAAEDRLIAASADVSRTVELHDVIRDGDMARMVQVQSIVVPANGKVELKPGSFHVMFMGLHAPLQEGGTIPLTLTFERAGTVAVTLPIKAMGEGPAMHGHGHHHQHGAAAADTGPADVTVFAAGPLGRSLQEVVKAFAAAGGGSVKVIAGHSPDHAKQIMEGAAGDLYFGVNGPWVAELVEKGRLQRDSVKPMLGNRLVVVARKDSALAYGAAPGESLAEKLGDGRLAIADPAVAPAGKAAQAALGKLGAWEAVAGRAALFPNLKGVVDAVTAGEAAAGVVLRTDALAGDALRIVAELPADGHPPMITVAGLINGDNAKARAFYDYLAGAEAQAIFARHGFSLVATR